MPEVRLLAGLRQGLGRGQQRLRVEAANVSELLEALVRNSGNCEGARSLVYADRAEPERRIQRDLRVLVNGRSVQFLNGLETHLDEDDTVTLHLTGMRGYPGG